MTDLSNMTSDELEAFRKENTDMIGRCQKLNDETDAEIERRKAEPDYAAWEPKWQAFREAMEWDDNDSYARAYKRAYIRALIAAHNTPLAGAVTDVADGHDEDRILKNALFKLEKMKSGQRSYGGVLTDNNQAAWITYELRPRPPLAGEWTEWRIGMPVPCGVSGETHESEYLSGGKFVRVVGDPAWTASLYRYRPRQS